MDNANLWILASNLGSFLLATDQGRQFPVWVSSGDGVKTITANVAGSASPVRGCQINSPAWVWLLLTERPWEEPLCVVRGTVEVEGGI